ncbi:Leucine-rich repeat [Trypanosoma melophagium]|uniref:Leucine-rich repeat n=1 Tax=Trypanosoma melophagium TaxID=715481 RepID=UPI00351A0DBC|nr:Leucine-rich repeat [Trypanosoma melophagium]
MWETASLTNDSIDDDDCCVDNTVPPSPLAETYLESGIITGNALLNATLTETDIAQVHTLRMIGSSFDDNTAYYVADKVLPLACALRTVEIASTKFSPVGLTSLLRALWKMPWDTLEHLSLSDVHLHYEECAMIQRVMTKQRTHLRVLQLRLCHMDDLAAQSIAEGVSQADCLQELFLPDSDVIPAFALSGEESLSFPKSLRILDISGNYIDPRHHRGLCRAFSRCASSLEEIYLARCSLTEDGLNALLRSGIHSSKALRVLNVASGRLFRGAGRVLCSVLTECPNLERLYVQDNFIEVDGAARMSIGISYAKKLTVLGMGRCHLESGGVRLIAEAVKHSCSLRELDLSGNNIHDDDVYHICALSREACLGLKLLDLSDNPLTKASRLPIQALLEREKENGCTVLVRGTELEGECSYFHFGNSGVLH